MMILRKKKRRPRKKPWPYPELSIDQILSWADAYHARTGRWPNIDSGRIREGLGESWRSIDLDLRLGLRGLPGKSSLAQLLAERRGVRNIKGLPRFTVKKVLEWADSYHSRTGRWPRRDSGPIAEAPGETWHAVASALCKGSRGFRHSSSLAQFLKKHRGARNHLDLPRLTVAMILNWIDQHRQRTGEWPRKTSGTVLDAAGESWSALDVALDHGLRGLPSGLSLPRLLAAYRGVPNPGDRPQLTEEQILEWADAFHARTGKWPKIKSGPIPEAPGDTWLRVGTALIEGLRGLPEGSSLARLLAAERGVRNHLARPRLTVNIIREWARAHRARTGKWPSQSSGRVAEAPDETWKAVSIALIQGLRGLPGNTTLLRVLQEDEA